MNDLLRTADRDEIARTIAYAFLDQPLKECGWGFLAHPFFDSYMQPEYGVDGQFNFVNILEDEKALDRKKYELQDEIAHSDYCHIMCRIRKQYRLAFYKYTRDALSPEEKGEYLVEAYQMAENPNQDANVSILELIDMFRSCKRYHLMSTEEQEIFEKLPEVITVYRGVGEGMNELGIAWTYNLDTAKWFANRFKKGGKVLKGKIKKCDVLACLESRNEHELVIDVTRIMNKEELDYE